MRARSKLYLIILLALLVAVVVARAAAPVIFGGEKYSVSLNSPTAFPIDI